MPICPICSKEMKYINNSHLKSHGLTPTQFKEQFPEVEYMSKEVIDIKKKNGLIAKSISRKTEELIYINRIAEYNKNPKKCLNCSCDITYDKRMNKFCSHSCASSLINKIRKVNYSEEAKELLKNLGKNLKRKIGWTEHKNNCVICNNVFLTNCKNRSRKTCSDKCKRKAHALNNHKKDETFGKWGYYQGIYCASSWELAFLVHNLDLGKNINRCDLTFKYHFEGEDHLYFPDFFMDGIIYEVKGRELEDVALKTKSVIDAGYSIQLIRKKQIEPIIKLLKEKYGVKDITKLYDKKN